jgi:signal transduction histidine kinase
LLIAGEALNNAFRHAQAHNIEAEVSFAFAELHVRIRDDGRGIDPAFLGAGGRRGHWGLAGMRERARKIRGSLNIWSKPDAGTEVDLGVPADVAYRMRDRESLNRWRSWLLGTEQ